MKSLAWSFGVSVVLAGHASFAEPAAVPARVRLVLSQCADLPFDATALGDLVRLELGAVGISQVDITRQSAEPSPATEAGAAVLVAVSRCDAGLEEIQLRVLDGGSGRSTDRTMHIADIPKELRARAIAIRVVELVRATWPALSGPPAPAPSSASETLPPAGVLEVEAAPRAGPSPEATVVVASSTRAPKTERPGEPARAPVSIEAAVAADSFPSRATGVSGPVAALAYEPSLLRLAVGAQALFGQTVVAQGAVNVGWASGYLAAGVRSKSVVLEPRIHLGYAWATGDSYDPVRVQSSSNGGFIAVLAVAGGVRGELSSAVDVFAGVEVGHTVKAVTFLADNDRAAGFAGALLSAELGVAVRPW